MKIKTHRLQLTSITEDDVDFIHKLNSQPEVAAFSMQDIPANIEETKRALIPYIQAQSNQPRQNYTFKLALSETNEPIGLAGISLSMNQFKMGEVFYKLLPAFWNNGYATEVTRCIIKLGFEDLKLHRIEANTNTDNYGSIRVLEKAGLQQEGLRRKIVPMNGKWNDGYIYAIIEDDYFL